jgi:flagellar motor switch protein FliN/FliY
MSEELEFTPLSAEAEPPAGGGDLGRLFDVSVELSVEVGRTRMTLGQALALGPGSVVALSRSAREPVDLLVNGKQVARGEVVVIDDDFGLRITEVNELDEAPAEAEPAVVPPDGDLADVA